MPAGEGSETDRSEGSEAEEKRQMKGGGQAQDQAATDQAGQAARRRPHRSLTVVEGNSARGRNESEQQAC
jgi:hypothetical protein